MRSLPASCHPRAPVAPLTPALVLAALALAGCGGGLGHRSVAEIQGEFELAPGIRRVRIEIANGTPGIAPPEDVKASNKVSYAGGVRRAADTAEGLAAVEAVPIALAVVPTPDQPDLLCIRGPQLPPGVTGVIGFEAGIRVPATVELEVVVSDNGHVTLADRAAPSRVTTGRGDLRFERCAGGVEAVTGQGVLIAFGHRGNLDVRSRNGDMQAFIEEPGDRITLDTGRGTVQCRVPETIEFELDARVEIGRIGNGFGLEVQQVGDYGAALVGRRGSGRTKVILRTASGHISFVPRKFD